MQVVQRKYGSWGWVNERELYERVTGRKLRRLNVTPLAAVADDFRNFTVSLMALPIINFQGEPVYPTEAFVGHIFDIYFEWRNQTGGGVGTGFYRLTDADTAEVLAYGEFPAAVGQAGSVTIPGLVMPNKNWNLTLEVGHLE